MKALKTILIALLFIASFTLNAQIAVNTDGTDPDGSAMLDVKSTEKGFLPPRMTAEERDDLQNPAAGLMIFCTTTNTVNVYNGTDWYELNQTIASDPPFICGTSTIADADNNTYTTVQIGTQCWMAENLKTTIYQNGTPIPNVTDGATWEGLTTGAYVWYDNDISWKDKYGALYNWHTTDDANGLCPTGWHVPTNDEWTTLTGFIGATDPGNKLKSCRQVNSPSGGDCNTSEHPRWNESSENSTDDYGFSGLPGGMRYGFESFVFGSIGIFGYWWSSTEESSEAWSRGLHHDTGEVVVVSHNKKWGLSVRCLKDD